jgi:hypothetical protein
MNLVSAGAVSFDSSSEERVFTIDYSQDSTFSGDQFTDYTVSVTGSAGSVTSVSNTSTFKLRIENPCKDSTFV